MSSAYGLSISKGVASLQELFSVRDPTLPLEQDAGGLRGVLSADARPYVVTHLPPNWYDAQGPFQAWGSGLDLGLFCSI